MEDSVFHIASRHYPGADHSSIIHRKEAQSDTDSLRLDWFVSIVTAKSSEWANGRGNMAYAAFFCAANILEANIMTKFLPSPDALSDDDAARLRHSGLLDVKEFFLSDAGQKLVQAARVLDWNLNPEPDADQVWAALEVLFTMTPTMTVMVQKTYLTTAKLGAFSASVLEINALLADRDHWSRELRTQEQLHSPEVLHFMRDPWNDEALLSAISSGYVVQAPPVNAYDETAGFGFDAQPASSAARWPDDDEDILSSSLSFGQAGRRCFGSSSSSAGVKRPTDAGHGVFSAKRLSSKGCGSRGSKDPFVSADFSQTAISGKGNKALSPVKPIPASDDSDEFSADEVDVGTLLSVSWNISEYQQTAAMLQTIYDRAGDYKHASVKLLQDT
eukprot:3849882-Karenia_brevis.AAC.1